MPRRAPDAGQRYPCDRCEKTYSRQDHLLRHKLNHDNDRVLQCDHCDRTFVRPDLLTRHLERHALRGKTLGRWSGRHRNDDDSAAGGAPSTAGSDGGVSDEPVGADFAASAKFAASMAAPMGREAEPLYVPRQAHLSRTLGAGSGSSGGGSSDGTPWHVGDTTSQARESWAGPSNGDGRGGVRFAYAPPPPPSLPPPPPPAPLLPTSAAVQGGGRSSLGQHEAAFYPSWGTPPAPSASESCAPMGGLPSSHATVAHAEGTGGVPTASLPDPTLGVGYSSGRQSHQWTESTAAAAAASAAAAPSRAHAAVQAPLFNVAAGPTGPDAYPFAAPPVDHTADYSWLFDGIDPFGNATAAAAADDGTGMGDLLGGGQDVGGPAGLGLGPNSGLVRVANGELQAGANAGVVPGLGGSVSFDADRASMAAPSGKWASATAAAAGGPSQDSPSQTAAHGQGSSVGDSTHLAELEFQASKESNALDDLIFFATLQADIPESQAFAVDDATQARLISFLASVPELSTSPLFTPSALRSYLWLYFKHFNTLYPLIHKPTFIANDADSMLLSAMIVIGAHFGDYKSHDLAVRCGSKLWGAYVSLEDFRPARATLPMLQAMVLTVAFGKLMSTRPQHETAHLFHSFVITLARRNACFSTPPSQALAGEPGSFEQWRSWAREEEKKRIALFAFVIDAQHATIFRHAPALSAFQLHLPLCCEEEEWDLASAEEWTAWRRSKGAPRAPQSFIQSLKATLAASQQGAATGGGGGGAGPAPRPDAFSNFVLLHGMLSVAYDLQWKQNILLNAEGNEGITGWRERLSGSFLEWKRRLGGGGGGGGGATDDSEAQPASETTRAVARASASLVVMAQLVLHADTVDIQIYAGLPSVLGRFIDVATFSAARRQVKEWARHRDGQLAVWVAANFLRSTLLGNGSTDFLLRMDREDLEGSAAPAPTANGAGDAGGGATASSAGRDAAELHSAQAGAVVDAPRVSHGRSDGLDELLHHRWVMYLCTLIVWAYGTALAPSHSAALGPRPPPRTSGSTLRATAASSAPLQNPRTAPSSPGPSRPQTIGYDGPLSGADPDEGSTVGVGGERPTNADPPAAVAGGGVPTAEARSSAAEARVYLERVASCAPSRIPELEEKFRTRGLLEVVERMLRGSRWELGREAAGVLRKLIRAESVAQSNAVATPAGTPPPLVKIEGA